MQNITQEKRIEAAKKLDPVFDNLYSAPKSGAYMSEVFYRNMPDNRNYEAYATIIGDTILGFHHSKDLPQLLQKEVGLSADEAQKVVRELAEFLSPVLEREAAEMDKKQAELKELEQQFTAKEPAADTSEVADTTEEPEAAAEPHEQHEVMPMRTMKGDMQRIHGYGAYREQFPNEEPDEEPVIKSEQETVLKKESLVETPKVDE